tara:strand:+ start:2786 stop:3130 length:345 start_codon:yes stop_codon:yes gene_type:complete
MNVSAIGSSLTPASTSNTQDVAAAQPSDESNGGNVRLDPNQASIKPDDDKMPGGAPKPLDQMPTSDFLLLREMFQGDSVMDKLAKIFETILALQLLEDTVENVNKSIEESITGE